MKKWKFIFSASFASLALPIASISCARSVETPAKIAQDQQFKDKNLTQVVENIYVENVLANLYQKNYAELINDINSNYFEDAYKAFEIYSIQELNKSPLYFVSQLSKFTSEGIFSDQQLTILKSADNIAINQIPSKEAFKIFLQQKQTGISKKINEILLVSKYFEINNKEYLEKINSDFKDNQDQYDLNYFNFISYLVKNKPVQKWGFESSDNIDIFSYPIKVIQKVSDYQDLARNLAKESLSVDPALVFTNNKDLEAKLIGYQGILIDQASKYNINFSVSDIKELKNDALSGFVVNDSSIFDLSKVDQEGNLEKSIKIYNAKDKKVSATYLNVLLPSVKEIKETVEDKEVTKQILSVENSYFADKIQSLIFAIALKDDKLFQTALEAFKKLGYSIQVDDETLKETLKESKLI
ncbi:hypothetical protein V2E24_01630 [Mycoplasmopsis ciconiae]|uniref:P60-like lipoprotein n=1 Tax=Mycoplasmopsis ciconiae TaxID=561067 RepID=A0ABU7MMJ2_9BACT|nr:hypothetical protein [Mycoplasmopsis ciconiae]